MTGAIKILTGIALISLPTVMFGGFSLLRLLTANKLSDFQIRYFRAGHAHAGVLVVLALLGRTDLGQTGQWVVGVLLVVGVLAQSGGMFVHMGVGKPGQWSAGNTLSSLG